MYCWAHIFSSKVVPRNKKSARCKDSGVIGITIFVIFFFVTGTNLSLINDTEVLLNESDVDVVDISDNEISHNDTGKLIYLKINGVLV